MVKDASTGTKKGPPNGDDPEDIEDQWSGTSDLELTKRRIEDAASPWKK
jgi:hypothetical protein